MSTETRTIRVTMSASLVHQLDKLAAHVGKSRSWVVVQLVELSSWDSLVAACEDGEVE